MTSGAGGELIRLLAHKKAQRRTTRDLTQQLDAMFPLVLAELRDLEREGLVRRWADGAWGLTSAGNLRRNDLTASPRGPDAVG
jgi:Mn-dependent DtxR family transcriptional regulator